MSFKAIDEIEHFDFEDCVVETLKVEPQTITLTLNALIVKKNNSQNTNFTDSYADTTQVVLEAAKLLSGVRDGYKYFDANGVLLDEVSDEPLTDEELRDFPSLAENAYLCDMSFLGDCDGKKKYELCFEFVDDETNTMGASYGIVVAFDRAVFCWDRYLNKVQK